MLIEGRYNDLVWIDKLDSKWLFDILNIQAIDWLSAVLQSRICDECDRFKYLKYNSQ